MLTIKDYASEVLSCLQEMGAKQSNPVLEILGTEKSFVENQKYPQDKLRFNNGVWRAYYHCHAEPYRIEGEHGHFHIFHRAGKEEWTHVAGLSIDSQGQAQKWFVTNRWVTNEFWQEANDISRYFKQAPQLSRCLLIERWLMAMLLLYQVELSSLLVERDQVVQQYSETSSPDSVLNDRSHYILAETEIKLQEKLNQILVE